MSNQLILGDNLEILKSLPSESVDLIYIDPPFFSNRNYEVIWGDEEGNRHTSDKKITSDNLLPKVRIHNKNNSNIITDTFQGYKDLKRQYKHETIKHIMGEYVRKSNRIAIKIHTNIEGFWGQLKRGIYGVYHWASKKHIQKYVNEFVCRYNNKEYNEFDKFANWFVGCEGKKLEYSLLIK